MPMVTKETSPTTRVQILVVDDHPNTANTLARALSQLGPFVNVISSSSGREALEKIKDKGVDILFTDMIMPEMTGLELIEKMQNRPGGRPAFTYLITAYDVPGLKVTAQRLKVNEVIVKPVRPERIRQIATQAIEDIKLATRPIQKTSDRKKRFKILVADDRPDNITLLTRYLEYEGYENITAHDGIDALNKVRDELPDLVLLDINMPNKDGFTVLEEIRADPNIDHIPVIILTAARLDPADVQSGLNLGADDYVTKPFDRHELMARIHTKLRVKEAEDVIRRRNRELSLLPEIGKELSARLDIKELANVLLKRTVEALGANQGSMMIFNANGNVKESYHVTSLGSNSSNDLMLVPEETLTAIKEGGQGFIIEDASDKKNWPTMAKENIRSVLIVPLFGRHELLGVLALTHERDHYFNLDHLLLLQAIASQASIALENSHLYADAIQQQKQLATVLQGINEAVMIFDEQGKLTMLNFIAEGLFPNDKSIMKEPLSAQEGYTDLVHLMDEARQSKSAHSGEVTWLDKRKFMAHVTPMEDGSQVTVLRQVVVN